MTRNTERVIYNVIHIFIVVMVTVTFGWFFLVSGLSENWPIAHIEHDVINTTSNYFTVSEIVNNVALLNSNGGGQSVEIKQGQTINVVSNSWGGSGNVKCLYVGKHGVTLYVSTVSVTPLGYLAFTLIWLVLCAIVAITTYVVVAYLEKFNTWITQCYSSWLRRRL